jgi:5-methylcytosine-specific restriction endonuclease McrA
VDHIIPLVAGGAHAAGNLCITCAECNLSKCDLSPQEFRIKVGDKRGQNKVIAQDYFRQQNNTSNFNVNSNVTFNTPIDTNTKEKQQ